MVEKKKKKAQQTDCKLILKCITNTWVWPSCSAIGIFVGLVRSGYEITLLDTILASNLGVLVEESTWLGAVAPCRPTWSWLQSGSLQRVPRHLSHLAAISNLCWNAPPAAALLVCRVSELMLLTWWAQERDYNLPESFCRGLRKDCVPPGDLVRSLLLGLEVVPGWLPRPAAGNPSRWPWARVCLLSWDL